MKETEAQVNTMGFKRYFMPMNLIGEYCYNVHASQSYLKIQCNSFYNMNDISNRKRKINCYFRRNQNITKVLKQY